jgi:hypothetical protein
MFVVVLCVIIEWNARQLRHIMHASCTHHARFRERHENFAEPALAPGVELGVTRTNSSGANQTWRRIMRTIVLVFSLIALATPSQAAQRTKTTNGASLEQKCHEMVGQEQYEGEGRSHIGALQAQRFSDCMMGAHH